MTTHFTSDIHHYHTNICKFTKRPYENVEDMNEGMLETINRIVKPQDTLYHLGDFSFSKKKEVIAEYLKRINGKVIMVLGNHDELFRKEGDYFLQNCPNLMAIHEERLRININKVSITLDHYPGRSWYKSCYGAWQLHGHTHGSMPMYGRSMDVGWDSPHLDGSPLHRPVSFDELYEFMKTVEVAKEFAE